MTTPLRIQRKRTKGFKLPPNTVSVTRPGRWANSFVVGKPYVRRKMQPGGGECSGVVVDAAHAVRLYRRYTLRGAAYRIDAYLELKDKNLACFCKLCPAHANGKPVGIICKQCAPCHADPLLEVANVKR